VLAFLGFVFGLIKNSFVRGAGVGQGGLEKAMNQ
jgi:hypothetical protein